MEGSGRHTILLEIELSLFVSVIAEWVCSLSVWKDVVFKHKITLLPTGGQSVNYSRVVPIHIFSLPLCNTHP